MECHVESCHRFNQREVAAEIGDRANRRRCRPSAADHGFAGVNRGAPHCESDQARGLAAQREGDLNRLAWRQIKAVKPGCGSTGEDRLPRKTPHGGGKHNIGVMSYRTERVIAATQPVPTRTEQVILRQPMPSSLREIKRTRRQSIWDLRSSRHEPKSWAKRPRNGSLPVKGDECCQKGESNSSNADWLHTQRLVATR